MKFIWDTTILLHFLRDSNTFNSLNDKYHFLPTSKNISLSIVSLGEIYSLKVQRNWGKKRAKYLEHILNKANVIPIYRQQIIQSYSLIDAYSQGKHPNLALPKGLTA